MSNEFGQRLCTARQNAEISQNKLGKKIKRDNSFLSYIENGERLPDNGTTLRLIVALQIPSRERAAFTLSAAGHSNTTIEAALGRATDTAEEEHVEAPLNELIGEQIKTFYPSQASAARDIGVDHSYISRLILGYRKKMGPELADNMIDKLQIPSGEQAAFLLKAEGYSPRTTRRLLNEAATGNRHGILMPNVPTDISS